MQVQIPVPTPPSVPPFPPVDTPAPWVLVEQDGRAVRRTIEAGIVGESQVEVVSGLAVGERVLLEPAEPGARIRLRD